VRISWPSHIAARVVQDLTGLSSISTTQAPQLDVVIAVVQPHRYTRLQSLFESFASCFNDADTVIVADVYPAGEALIEGADKSALVAAIKTHGHRHAIALASPEELAGLVREIAHPGDYVVFLGAGNITQWAYALPGELAAGDGA
jgi:UDP-N-acetylmuramate--alanine ligase